MITMENFIHRLMEFDFKKSENSKLLFRLNIMEWFIKFS